MIDVANSLSLWERGKGEGPREVRLVAWYERPRCARPLPEGEVRKDVTAYGSLDKT